MPTVDENLFFFLCLFEHLLLGETVYSTVKKDFPEYHYIVLANEPQFNFFIYEISLNFSPFELLRHNY